MKKTLFIILDGAAEPRANDDLRSSGIGKSALSLAEKPNLDVLASNSFCGMWAGPKAPKNYNVKSLSELATLELLGYSWSDSPGRGFLEALGIGLRPKKNSIYFRANFATVDKKLNIIDRRAGRDETGLKALSKKINMKIDGISVRFYKGVGHRGVLEISGSGLSNAVGDSDTGKNKPDKIVPLSKNARKTAYILNIFLKRSHDILNKDSINKKRKPANYILIRGAGRFKKAMPFKSRYGMKACSVSNSGIVQGISRYLGIDVINAREYSDVESNLAAKTDIAVRSLERYDFVLIHINGADVFAHNKDLKGKVKFIERIDSEVFSRISYMRNIKIVVTSDHETSSKTGEHVFGPVPFLFYNGEDYNDIKNFDESSCGKGSIIMNPMDKIMCCD
ncbi:MAG: 2,3-bisphosphoglycerate-independent phosphoglycerate mutase [Candidatus Aenigmarchaeota archaeon]|nr:2,3-bisphosphoglycerate-independent phosphoglycerate mutase [Candidatus Aenigmarchaeota archaeon]